MRTGLFGSVSALLAVAPLALARPGIPPAELPPAIPAATAQVQDQPAAPAAPAPSPTAPAAQAGQGGVGQPGAGQQPTQQAWRDEHCGPREEFWFGGGYLLWRVKGGPENQPLATAVTGFGTAGPLVSTTVLGDNHLDYGTFNGINLSGGMWLNDRHTAGFEMSGFLLEQRSAFGTVASDPTGAFGTGGAMLIRPVINALTAAADGAVVAAPGAFSGAVAFGSSSQLGGAEVNFVKNLFHTQDYTIDTVFGFRYLDLDETLAVYQSTTDLGGGLTLGGTPLPAGSTLSLLDSFRTRNQFYGGQIGTRAEYRWGPVFFDLTSKLALGPMHEVVTISGETTGGGTTVPGGLLAVGGGNVGRFVTNRFAAVPEVGGQVGVQVNAHVRVSVGYDFLYANDVVRPGSQIDPVVSPRLVPSNAAFGALSGPAAPLPTGRHDDFYAHGVNFSVEMRY